MNETITHPQFHLQYVGVRPQISSKYEKIRRDREPRTHGEAQRSSRYRPQKPDRNPGGTTRANWNVRKLLPGHYYSRE